MSADDSDSPPTRPHTLPSVDSLDFPRRVVSGRKRERTSKDYAGLSIRDVARMLIQEQKRNEALEQVNFELTTQLTAEVERSDAAERRCRDLLQRLKTLNEERLAAQRGAARADEELKLYKLRLEEQREETKRALSIVGDLDNARQSAEEDAARARTRWRKAHEQALIERAMEQGHREGYAAGLRRGQDDGYEDGRYVGYEEGRENSARALETVYEAVMGEDTPAALGSLRNLPEPRTESERDAEPETEPMPEPEPAPPPPQSRTPSHYRTGTPHSTRTRTPVLDPRPAPSPRHPDVPIPPDNYIPSLDDDQRIRLPPPHELQRTPGTPSAQTPLPPEPEEIRFIPPPAGNNNTRHSRRASTDNKPPRARRRSSPDSQSTTISQFGIVNESPPQMPEPVVMPQPQAPPFVRERRQSGLSVIPEVLSGSTSPAPSFNRGPEQPPLPTTSFQPPYRPPSRSASHVSTETGRQSRASRRSGGPSQPIPEEARNSVSSGMSVPDITIVPPSRPGSNRSLQSHAAAQGWLSPQDANRPLPTIHDDDDEPQSQPQPASTQIYQATPVSMGPIVLPNGQLFTPTEVIPTPAAGTTDLPNGPGNTVPFPPTPSYVVQEQPPTQPVIPEGYGAHGRLPGTRYDSSSTDATTETTSSGDTLTTPPPRSKSKKTKTARSAVSSSGYTAAGVPLPASGYTAAGVPLPASGYTAAGVPLPPSTVGSSTPHTSFYAQTPSRTNAGMTPGPGNRPLSFLTERSLGMGGFAREN